LANDCEALSAVELYDTRSTPPVTYEFELALDIRSNWRVWFDDDGQLLINYIAGTYEAVNAILKREASVQLIITHM
jgi:hypothetical protein